MFFLGEEFVVKARLILCAHPGAVGDGEEVDVETVERVAQHLVVVVDVTRSTEKIEVKVPDLG